MFLRTCKEHVRFACTDSIDDFEVLELHLDGWTGFASIFDLEAVLALEQFFVTLFEPLSKFTFEFKESAFWRLLSGRDLLQRSTALLFSQFNQILWFLIFLKEM